MHAFADVTTPVDLELTLSGVINPETGILDRVIEWRADGQPDGLPICTAAILRGAGPPECGYGKGFSLREAVISAVGEALEIHASSTFDLSSLRHVPITKLEGDAVDPESLCLYADPYYDLPAFPYARFDQRSAIHWTTGSWLDNGEPVWVPALPVFRNFLVPANERFCQVTSNGLATGLGFQDAALRATLELIERDAFMLSWFCRLPGRELDVEDSLDTGEARVLQAIRNRGGQIKFYLLNAGIDVPTVMCIARGDGKTWPGATLGLGCHLSARVAVRKAILELGQTGLQFCDAMRAGEERIPRRPGEVQTFRQHALFYLPAERKSAFDFFGSDARGPIKISALEAPEHESEKLREKLREAGIRVAIIDLTTPAMRASGLSVVRAMGENMQQIHCGYGRERLANPRLQKLLTGPIHLAIPPVC